MDTDKYIENRLCAVDKILQHTVSDKDMCIMDNDHRNNIFTQGVFERRVPPATVSQTKSYIYIHMLNIQRMAHMFNACTKHIKRVFN